MKPELQNYSDRWLDVLQTLDDLLGRSAVDVYNIMYDMIK